MIANDDPSYYATPRYDIAPLLPVKAADVLEVGSGAGSTIRWLRERWPNAHFTAIDGLADMRDELLSVADEVHISDLNKALPVDRCFDLILALDVLEHLVEPSAALKALVACLKPGGQIIVSVPNVARITVSVPLLFGKFNYTDGGILDRTHLRFFTKKSATDLMSAAGLSVADGLFTGVNHGSMRMLDLLTASLARPILARQFIMRGVPVPTVRPVRWRLA